jgi:tagatose 6-phosphate kinase
MLCIGTTPTVQRTLVFKKLVPDEVNRAVEVDEYASGKSVNVARVAAAIGSRVVVTGFAGGDRGRFLADELSRDGVQHDFEPIKGQTRLCTTVIDRAADTVTELVEEHAAVTRSDLNRLLQRCQKHMEGGKCGVVVLSGSLPPGADPSFYRRVIEIARHRKLPVLLDGRGEPLRRALHLGGFIAKFNRAELAETVGDALRTDAAFKKAMRQVCPNDGAICITMGKHGAAAFDGENYWRINTPVIQAVNPIGSGDAFAAGLAAVLENGGTFAEGCRLGSACGAANAMTARAGVVAPALVHKLHKKVKITKW